MHYGRVFISFLHLHRILQRKKILSYSLSLTSAEVLCIEVIKTHEISISLFRHPIYLFPFSLYLGAFAFSACFTIDIRFQLGDHLILLECLTPFSDFYIHVRATRINNSIRSIVRVHFDSTFSTLLYLFSRDSAISSPAARLHRSSCFASALLFARHLQKRPPSV